MQPSRSYALAHGALAGVLAGAVVALWFLVVDAATATVLRTPALLAEALLGDARAPGLPLIASFTIVHMLVFVGLGMAAAAALRLTGLTPGPWLGAVFGIAVLDGVHYGTLLLAGRGVLSVLPATQVLMANLVAGMVLMAWLHRAWRTDTPFVLGRLRSVALLERALIAGAVGAATVALWMFALDLAAGRPLFTPAALGSVFFLGAQGPDDVRVSVAIIGAYTLLHLSAFAIAGFVIEWATDRLERAPRLWLFAPLTFIVLEALFLGTVGAVGPWVLTALGVVALASANIVAVAAMGVWVWMRHPRLRRELAGVFAAS